jgi:prepilin-type N-terminal cleavage/methylation domain-containing protein
MTKLKSQKAFTMLELIFVIVILGIVSSIGAEIIANVYRSYVLERATHRSSIKTELAANQLANRLAYSIPGTVIGRKATGYKAIDNLDDTDYEILEWIGYDNDSFSAQATPGWSGFIDLDASSKTSLKTKGSDLSKTNTIIQKLGGSGIGDSAIFFPGEYNAQNVGYGGAGGDSSGAISVGAGSTSVDLAVGDLSVAHKTIKEHYKLAWSAYAVVPRDNHDGTFDLDLYYDYQPWNTQTYSNNGKSQTLIRNVSVFKFVGSENTIRFKICQREKITQDKNITICKEKAVIR